eukprot:304314_1
MKSHICINPTLTPLYFGSFCTYHPESHPPKPNPPEPNPPEPYSPKPFPPKPCGYPPKPFPPKPYPYVPDDPCPPHTFNIPPNNDNKIKKVHFNDTIAIINDDDNT